MEKVLNVFYQDTLMGTLSLEADGMRYAYTDAYLKNPNAHILSQSLPLEEKTFTHIECYPFFSGLLPDAPVRQTIAKYLGISTENVFGLLEAIGGECAGAISFYPQDINPHGSYGMTYRILEDVDADRILTSLEKKPMMVGEEGIRLSGAGAQDKLIISVIDGKVAIPTGTTPSTHIIKPPIKNIDDSIFNEFFCMRLAQKVGLRVPAVDLLYVLKKPYYLVERYDRRMQGNLIIRMHQEDLCQALHVPSELKYESEGGPNLAQCFDLLNQRIQLGFMPGVCKLRLYEGVIFNFLIGNGDAHGKNFSLLYEGDAEQLAPFYDLLSTVIYANDHKAKMAMKIMGTYKFKEISRKKLQELGVSIGFRADFSLKVIQDLIDKVRQQSVLLMEDLNAHPETRSKVYAKIVDVIDTYAKQLS